MVNGICRSLWLFITACFLVLFVLKIEAKEAQAVLDLQDLFSPYTDNENGIKGVVNSGGRIDVKLYEETTNTLVFHVYITSSSSDFSGIETVYNKSDLGAGAKYYPNTWNSRDIKTALGSMDRYFYDSSTIRPYPFLRSKVNLKIQITETNAAMQVCKIPGLGLVDESGGNYLFHPNHYCHDLRHSADFATKAWVRFKSPDINKPIDLVLAAHRGVWGFDNGSGYPENSSDAIRETKKYTDVLESDVMLTGDRKLIVSHDYDMHRLSNYEGDKYIFELTEDVLSTLKLRKKNMEVSDYHYLMFSDMMDLIKEVGLIFTVDIKDLRARYDRNGNCIANCDYDPTTHGEEAKKKIFASWVEIFRGCIKIAMEKKCIQYVAFKLPYSYDEVKKYVSEDTLSQVLYMPVIYPDRQDHLDFVDDWYAKAGKQLAAWQTNYRYLGDRFLVPFERAGKHYENLLHYVYEKTGVRPGQYPEESMDPKGVVNRWGDWSIKNLTRDIRGDHYLQMTIPYAKIMVMTTDRTDVWHKVAEIYSKLPK